ncbi:ac57 [Artaxa digramma nucleopolyhedrovirus]|uniref:Ac57 n=1 Tax=Artaxa digramma nucleopolyhedrovirus TaxID=3070910 RepID=A0AAE6R6T9_9ABAC|nr:ac57 [Euproctis digramma nucleopolyhedrovirus]QHB21694.1 ac57 [Artaxa digramma nucleopolyhedrovirus]
MSSTVNVKFIEFGGVGLDLRHLNYSVSSVGADNREYIIFLNVNKAFYINFNIVCDMSLETLTHYIYENVKYTIDGELQQICKINYEHFIINEHDKNKSIVIEYGPGARIIVAETIRPNEKYNQRVSGYIDFENRHESMKQLGATKPTTMTVQERSDYDRRCEIELLKYT